MNEIDKKKEVALQGNLLPIIKNYYFTILRISEAAPEADLTLTK